MIIKNIPHVARPFSHTARHSRQPVVRSLAAYGTVQDTHTHHSSTPPPPPPPPHSTFYQKPSSTVKQDQLFSDETRLQLERLRQHHFHATNLPDSPDFGTNQYLNINEELRQQLKDIVAQFHAPVRYAFAYGSGVFQQTGYDKKNKPMIDFIFGVSHPEHWHALNMQQNPHHYSGLRYLGSNAVSYIEENFGAGVYFNPYVEVNGVMIKYGVVSIDRLCRDLIDWETLYVAGRMHKPVKILRDDARVRLANQVNLTEAVRVALLTLPETFDQVELYERIAGISYMGDFRMTVGENPNKVKNIVGAQLGHFHRLYFSLLDDLPNVAVLNNGQFQQNLNPKFRGLMVQKLPRTLYDLIMKQHREFAKRSHLEVPMSKASTYQQIASSPNLPQYMDQSLRSIIARPALTQSIKGIFTAGVFKSSRYVSAKLGKWAKAK
ncbi:Mmp37-domain-containing protein [Hesseltinella vesiculosa]|uniref:Phosphatidate cytidylyltransferase, mitochondrial n=1 Tax=Hesseltinella vesiculosa TaxID=101127 RepID=A0A1X2GKX0_9FUNG|nr:Mmp37-domain-containing protein [Hesseltinella vesiculosa]